MAFLKPTRTVQYPVTAEFTFSFDDTMTNTASATDGFATVATHVFDVLPLPANSIVVSGSVVTETAVTGSTAYNVSVGDSASADRYLGVTNRVASGITALVPTGYVGAGENLRLTVSPTVATATAGKVTVRVQYVMRGKANEPTGNLS